MLSQALKWNASGWWITIVSVACSGAGRRSAGKATPPARLQQAQSHKSAPGAAHVTVEHLGQVLFHVEERVGAAPLSEPSNMVPLVPTATWGGLRTSLPRAVPARSTPMIGPWAHCW